MKALIIDNVKKISQDKNDIYITVTFKNKRNDFTIYLNKGKLDASYSTYNQKLNQYNFGAFTNIQIQEIEEQLKTNPKTRLKLLFM